VAVELLVEGPRDAGPVLILAHGAGQPSRSAFMNAIAAGLAGGGVRVVRGIGSINALLPRSPKYRAVVRWLSILPSTGCRGESQPPEPGNCP
jgi:hypothetical protein